MEQLQGRRRWRLRASRRRGVQVTAVLGSAALVSALGVAVTASAGLASAGHAARAADSSSCHLGNGIKHVISIQFDNVHFFRDNPNVPSDLQMMPNLLDFFLHNGALLYLGAVAYLAEAAGHHPDVSISWNKVTLTLSTHSAGGLTANDFALARQISALS